MLRKVFILIIGLLSAISTYSEIVNVDNVSYDLEAGTKTAKVIAKTEKYSGNIVIPSSVKYKGSSYNVTGIGDRSFWSCEFLSFISIPSSVTSIEGDVFSGCNSLTSINVSQDNPNYCSDMGVLFDKNKTTLIHYPANKSGSSYSVPNSVRNIEECAFRYCPNLTSISIPNSVMSIGSGAFHGCSGLSSVTIPRGVKSIENRTFKDCSSLISVTIPNSVISIGKGAFESCSDLESITIPNSVTIIGNSAFRGCTALTSVTIPSSVTSIGKKVFESCGLTSVTIPSSVTNIGGEAFSGCNSLTSINVSQDNPNYCSDMGVLFDKNKTTLIHYPANKSGSSYSVPNSVKSIEPLAFSNCDHLESVLIPNSVTSIELFAFSKCRYLESVTIPNSVTSIGNNAFYGCDNLTVRTSSSASLANAGIPEDRIIRISQEEALADYAQADNTSLNAEESEEDVVFRVVEWMPSFPGGDAALMQFISDNLQYPAIARENGSQARAICQFTIEKDGAITNIEIVRSAGDETLNNEAKRLIQSMPKWNPGRQRGRVVRVSYTLPINFRLSDVQKPSWLLLIKQHQSRNNLHTNLHY